MTKKRWLARLMAGLMGAASGGVLLQSTGCTIDEELFNELVNLTLEIVLESLTSAS